MTTTMNISLPDELKAFVEEQINSGRYSSASEYVRELIRDAQKQAARKRLEDLLIEGLESGEPIEVTPEFWRDLREKARLRLAEHMKGTK